MTRQPSLPPTVPLGPPLPPRSVARLCGLSQRPRGLTVENESDPLDGVSPGLQGLLEQGRPGAAISVPLVSDAPPTPLSVAHAKAPHASLLFWGVLSVSLVFRSVSLVSRSVSLVSRSVSLVSRSVSLVSRSVSLDS
ncbi:unnamed protein product, partial [Arctogadus glacialis]